MTLDEDDDDRDYKRYCLPDGQIGILPGGMQADLEIRLDELDFRQAETFKESPMNSWRNKLARDGDIEMAKLACIILGLPVSQVTVERAFSILPLVLTSRRNNLGPNNLEHLMTLKVQK